MNDLPDVEFIAWHDREPAYLPDIESAVRWGQMHGLLEFRAYRIDNDAETVTERLFERAGGVWRVSAPFGPVREVAADPSNDPRVLAIVNFVHANIATIVEPIRVGELDWPEVAARSGSKRAQLGYVPPTKTPLNAWVWGYCPDIIAARTRALSDEEFDYFLAVIDSTVSLHKLHADVPLVEREKLVDAETIHTEAGADLMRRLS